MDKLFSNKRTYVGTDDDEYIDLCIPCADKSKITSNALLRVREDEDGRLDKFTYRYVSKDSNMIDLVMYANHIFNPFSIKSGDLLYTPLDNINSVYQQNTEPTMPDGTKHSNNSQVNKEKTYAENIEYLARMGLGIC